MAKKITYGNVEFGREEFKDENGTALISIKMPLTMLKELRRLALNEKHQGRYQTLMKDVLAEYIAKQGQDKKRKSV